MRKWLLPIILAGGFGILIAFCAGVIRPPRPMFHEAYGAGGFGFIPTWQPNPAFFDHHGQGLYFDAGDNLIVFQATGVPQRSRSRPMIGGRRAARFRLGSADDKPDDHYVTIPRTRDRLIVILPDGRWEAHPIGSGKARQVHIVEISRDQPTPDLLESVVSVLDGHEKALVEEFLKGYTPP
jgi:hypothetical protein